MQLNGNTSIRHALALATCTLLGTPPHEARAETAPDSWRVDASVLYYSEEDRVTVVEPVLFMRSKIGEDSFRSVRLVYDAMTGASPNGATATNTPQTFTAPSGGSSYTTPAGKTPLKDFEDKRVAVSVEWEKPLDRLRRVNYGVNASVEEDYLSFGLGTNLMQDFNDRLTTMTYGIAANLDFVSPTGGAPKPLQLLSVAAATPSGGGEEDEDEGEEGEDRETKIGVDAIVGVTQVLTRRALTQLNYSVGLSSGYLTDPYKVLSVVDGSTGATVDYRFESRPDSRLRQSVYWKIVYHFDKDVVNFSYRYFWDDWGIRAHTTDLHYRLELGKGFYLQPHYRYSTQTAADFYHHSLVNTAPVPEYASADYRLGEMVTTTAGLKFGVPTGKSGELSLRVESMTQSGESHPADAIGIQRNFDLFPTVKIRIAQLTYTGRF
jgi:hypothetical protein